MGVYLPLRQANFLRTDTLHYSARPSPCDGNGCDVIFTVENNGAITEDYVKFTVFRVEVKDILSLRPYDVSKTTSHTIVTFGPLQAGNSFDVKLTLGTPGPYQAFMDIASRDRTALEVAPKPISWEPETKEETSWLTFYSTFVSWMIAVVSFLLLFKVIHSMRKIDKELNNVVRTREPPKKD